MKYWVLLAVVVIFSSIAHASVDVVGLESCVTGTSSFTVVNHEGPANIVVSTTRGNVVPATASIAENEARVFTLYAQGEGEVRVFADGKLVAVAPYCTQAQGPKIILPATVQANACSDIVVQGRIENSKGAKVTLDSTLGDFFPNPVKGDDSFELVIHPEDARVGENLVRVYGKAAGVTGFGTMRVTVTPCTSNVNIAFTEVSDGTIVQATVKNPSATPKVAELVTKGDTEQRVVQTIAPYGTQTLTTKTQDKEFTATVLVDGQPVATRTHAESESAQSTGLSGFFTLGGSGLWALLALILLAILLAALFTRRQTAKEPEQPPAAPQGPTAVVIPPLPPAPTDAELRQHYLNKLESLHARVRDKVQKAAFEHKLETTEARIRGAMQ